MYDVFFKAKVCFDYLNFLPSLRKVARKYKVSKSSVSRWLNNCSRTLKKRKRRRTITDQNIISLHAFCKNYVSHNSFFTLQNLQQKIYKEFKIQKSVATISRHLKKCKISRKRTTFKNNVPERTSSYDYSRLYSTLQEPTTVSIDETCFYYSETPSYGYAFKGTKVIRKINPYANAKNRSVSLLVAITASGVVDYKIQSTCFNSESFNDFIENLNVRDCKIVMDNVAFHKTKIVSNTCKRKNIETVFIPPYSPEYNPIEMFFSVLKSHVRLENVNVTKSDSVVQDAINNIRSRDYSNMFRHCAKECLEKLQR